MFKSILALFVVLFIIPASVVADDHSSSDARTEVQSITREIHDLLEGAEHSHSLRENLRRLSTRKGFVEWVKAFNLKKTALDAYRIYHIKSGDPRTRDHVANLALLFPLSHTIEMTSGPVMSAVSAGAGLPEFVTGALGIMGAVISVPGLDPLCILIYMSYPASQRMQNSVTYLREGATSILSFTGTYLGLKRIAKPVGHWLRQSWVERAYQNLIFTEDGLTMFADSQFVVPLLHLTWSEAETAGEEHKYFGEVRFSAEALRNLKESQWRSYLSKLPYNLRDAIEVARTLVQPDQATVLNPKPFYIQSVDVAALKVAWKHRSVVAGRSLQMCQELLSSAPKVPPPDL